MGAVYLSRRVPPEVAAYLRSAGREVRPVPDEPRLPPALASHPDLVLCRLPQGLVRADPARLGAVYPADAAYCAAALDGLFVHRLDITAPELLAAARRQGLAPLDVRQGYTKCSLVVVDGSAVITADQGLAEALFTTNVKVLTVEPGHVLLPGYDVGFLGGASGRVGDEVLFTGDLTAHPDHARIAEFVEGRGLAVKDFPGFPLTDFGSILEE